MRGCLRCRHGHAKGSGLTAAVHAMRLYLGSLDFTTVRDQQKRFNKVKALVEKIASAHGMAESSAWSQIESEARRQGIIRPMPGQHL